MVRSIILFLVLIGVGIGAYFYVTPTGVDLGHIQFAFNKDRQEVFNRTKSFLEDIKFKDFQRAATYHTPEEQGKADIPKLIEEKFLVKPEVLDVRDIEVSEVELDSTGDRARSKSSINFKVLNTNEVKTAEIILYWKKINGNWYMQLRSSLEH